MPNWVENHISITTNHPVLIDLLIKVEKTYAKDGVFDTLKPIGEWEYEKACHSWGCKWDISDPFVSLRETDGQVDFELTGQTPWCSPDNLLKWVIDTFNNDGFETNTKVAWLEEGGEWGVYENSETVANGFLSVKDKKSTKTEAWDCLGNYFDLEGWLEGMFEDDEDEDEDE